MSKSPFINQISSFMRLNGYSLRTEKTYLQWTSVLSDTAVYAHCCPVN
mgnify:CR=1 FL=1